MPLTLYCSVNAMIFKSCVMRVFLRETYGLVYVKVNYCILVDRRILCRKKKKGKSLKRISSAFKENSTKEKTRVNGK